MRAIARRIASKLKEKGFALKVLVIDYLQLLAGNPRTYSREQQVAENSRAMKDLAKDLSVPVIVLSQLNRAIETRGKNAEPQLSDLRESGAIEQDADFIVFLAPGEEDGVVLVNVAKGRHFGTGKTQIGFEKRYTRFAELEKAMSGLRAACDWEEEG